MTYAKLRKLAKTIELLAAGETDFEQISLLDSEDEMDLAAAIGVINSPRYLSDQWGESVGVRVDCQTEDGYFRVDTDDGLLSSEGKSVPISEDACELLNSKFDELKQF